MRKTLRVRLLGETSFVRCLGSVLTRANHPPTFLSFFSVFLAYAAGSAETGRLAPRGEGAEQNGGEEVEADDARGEGALRDAHR